MNENQESDGDTTFEGVTGGYAKVHPYNGAVELHRA